MGNKRDKSGTALKQEEKNDSSNNNKVRRRRSERRRSVRDSILVKLAWNKVNEEKGRHVKEDYEVLEKIGVGSISTISKIRKKNPGGSSHKKKGRNLKFGFLPKVSPLRKKMRHSDNNNKMGALYALKKIDVSLLYDDYLDELRNEIDILKSLDHPNILKAFETFEKKKHISIVMELCTGGDLKSREPYTESESAAISSKILSAVSYLHENNIIHRDLKFENIMYESNRSDAEIKIIDFGLSKTYKDPNQGFSERVGTIYTMAPEVMKGNYTYKADMWSVGVICYMLLSGKEPFPGKRRKEIKDKVIEGKYNFNDKTWDDASETSKDFVSSLLRYDPTERLTAKEAQEHDWLQSEYPLSNRTLRRSVMEQVSENIVQYSKNAEFKKLALNVIAYKSTAGNNTTTLSKIRQAFDQFDADNDGSIRYSDFEKVLSDFGYSKEEINKIFSNVDINKNGVIWYTEFLAATIEAQGRIDESRLAEAFDRLDCDNTGYISKKNLCTILGNRCQEEKISRIIDEVDSDGDGQISYKEFMNQFVNENKKDVAEMRSSMISSVGDENGFALDG